MLVAAEGGPLLFFVLITRLMLECYARLVVADGELPSRGRVARVVRRRHDARDRMRRGEVEQ